MKSGLVWFSIDLVEGCLEDGNEPPDSVKRGWFLDERIDYQLLKKDSAARASLVTCFQQQ
jgi:hypothetical protein